MKFVLCWMEKNSGHSKPVPPCEKYRVWPRKGQCIVLLQDLNPYVA